MNILDQIVKDKKIEVAAKQQILPLELLQSMPLFKKPSVSLAKRIVHKSGIISEFKRRSPSRQIINQKSHIIDVVKGYKEAGVSGVSILADTKYFGGALEDLMQARAHIDLPILRKEFIIDNYQIYEAKAFGADVILLIAAILTPEEIYSFSKLAHQLGLETLLEVHNQEELEKSNLEFIDLVGVNNRNLKTFEVSLNTSKILAEKIPKHKIKVSESGISSVEAIKELKQYGYQGFLMGENFMKYDSPGEAAQEFIKRIDGE